MFNQQSGQESMQPIPQATSDKRQATSDKDIHTFTPQLLQVGDIWQNYFRGAISEQALLQALSKRVAEFEFPVLCKEPQSKFAMATLLAQWPFQSKHDIADAIDALLDWAEEYAITVVDGAKVSS